jgi:hypothetical protein
MKLHPLYIKPWGRKGFYKVTWIIFLLALTITSCSQSSLASQTTSTPPDVSETAGVVTAQPTNTSIPEPSPSPTQPPIMVWLAPYLPEKLVESITLPAGYSLASSQEAAEVILTVDTQAQSPSSQWVYALVAPFPTVTDGVSFEQLQSAWTGNPPEPFASSPLLMDALTKDVLGKTC